VGETKTILKIETKTERRLLTMIRHSTVPWHGRGDRRTMFFKYVQRDMKWSKGGLSPGR
jgi:hypothetical protein